ncbi:MAG: YafY family transcriptional regulator [Acidobacteria bacterium]|nr:YafY family transcriptional regulator [Acidobacteriota bacterium]
MRRAERLFRLVNEMRTRSVVRAKELAEHLEVSVSTIYRDIAHLQASGLPIEGEAGVGYLLRPGFDLPNVTFTEDQVDALAVGLSFVERTGDPVLATAAREARAKIQAGMPRPEERKLADAPYFSLQDRNRATPSLALLRRAIRERQVAQFDYQDGTGNQTERRVRPLVIWNLTDGWMFSAWCELRQDFRTFRFDRTANLAMTGERFDEDEATGLRAFMESERCEAPDH